MIETIQLIDFQDLVKCQDLLHKSRESFLPVNYKFKRGNSYGLISDFGCGAWGLSTCLGGRGSHDYNGKVLLNNHVIVANSLLSCSGFISEKIYEGINSEESLLTPKDCIVKALSISKQPFSVEEIKNIFCLSDNRFERSLEYVSGEIWFISMAINFALGKEIFCYPWLNAIDIERFIIAHEHKIIDFLKKMGKIIIVPSSQKKVLQRYCDKTITFEKDKIIYHKW